MSSSGARVVLQDSLFVSVKDKGALGNGVADDAAAIQVAINAVAASGSGVVYFPRGDYLCNTALTFPTDKQVELRGSGMGGAGYAPGTRLRRTSGTASVINAVGTGSNDRVQISVRDMEIHGGGIAGDPLVNIERGAHILINNVRVSNSGRIGLRAVEWWDSVIDRVVIENCGSGTTYPAFISDSVTGGGSNANTATVHIINSIWQGNAGTDIKLTGSIADASPSNELQFVNCKMESGTGTQPFIDLDYAQSCTFNNVKILVPLGRTPTAVVQQLNTAATSIGARANMFVNCTIDSTSTFDVGFDIAVGTLQSYGTAFVGSPTIADVRIASTVIPGRVRIVGPTPHGVTDNRAVSEHLDSALGNASLAGSDVLVYRDGANRILIAPTNPVSGAALVVQGGDSGTTNALQVTTPTSTTAQTAFAIFNGRARIGYDGTLAAAVVDDGNVGGNKPVILRSTGLPRLTVETTGDVTTNTGNSLIATVGKGIRVKEGSNAKQGVATLVAGTITVANTSITANSRIILSAQDNNSVGSLRVSARTAATSFVITSSNAGDTGVVAYQIFEPA